MDGNHVLETVLRNVDGAALFSKWVRDFADASAFANATYGAGGALPDVVPFYGGGMPDADPAWGLAAWVVPATLASYFDDARLESFFYPFSRAYLEHWVGLAQAHGGAPNTTKYGDWGSMWGQGMPQPLIVPEHAPFFYALALDAQAGAASRLGLAADAARYQALAAGARALLLTHFDAATGCFSNCSATSQVFGLAAGVLAGGSAAHGAAWARALAAVADEDAPATGPAAARAPDLAIAAVAAVTGRAGAAGAAPGAGSSQPQGCRAASSRTEKGMRGWRSTAKNQASEVRSNWASAMAPAVICHGSPRRAVTRSINWNGGPGRRAILRPLSASKGR
jgi:hypothetical protein